MHPSLISSTFFAAPPMPWHPEELHKQVLVLEKLYDSLPDDMNARTAMAKAVVWAASSFLEGCLQQLVESLCAEEKIAVPKLGGLANKREFVISRAKKKSTFSVDANNASTRFVEDTYKDLRNKVDHGNKVNADDLHLDNVSFFRNAAADYLDQLYRSFGIGRPGWL